ncbi:MAG: prolyl oligopeptidase family serine peptidase, partial [Chthoniobacteraceae bacterium]
FFAPPSEFAHDFGDYRSPLTFSDGHTVKTAAEWPERRAEILKSWHAKLGAWPAILEKPRIEIRATERRENFTQHKVRVDIGPGSRQCDGYLLVPDGDGPFPAVLAVFYEPETAAGLNPKSQMRDFAYQLAKRGFVTLSIGTPGALDHPGMETRELLIAAGDELKIQPLTYLAYVAANCHTALAARRDVDAKGIGIIGHSYGGKWSMFASCLCEKFAAAVWCDPGIVFDESNTNINYYEPWYLGWEAGKSRPRGVPNADKPRTGLYKKMFENRESMVDLLALMAPRPFLVSGGSEDVPWHWRALNHTRVLYELLGAPNRVAMTQRDGHSPTPEAMEQMCGFLEHFLKRGKPGSR